MSFPQLTEIAGARQAIFRWRPGLMSLRKSATWDDNPILVDWGNAPASTHRFTYWFQLDNVDSNLGLRPRAQIRAANAPPDPMNIDIIATTLSSGQAGTGGGATTFRRLHVAPPGMDLDEDDRPNEVLYGRRFAPHANEHANGIESRFTRIGFPGRCAGRKAR